MLVSKEKYNNLLAAFTQLEAEKEEGQKAIQKADQQIKELNETIEQLSDQGKPEHDNILLSAQLEAVQGELAEANKSIEQLTSEKQEIQTQLDQSNQNKQELTQTVADLQLTIEKLNEGPAASPSRAFTQTDDPETSEDLNSFMKKNKHNTMACIARLKQDGFAQ